MPAYLRPTIQSDRTLKFAARTYMGALAIAVLGGGALSGAYALSNRLARLYFLILGVLCVVGAVWRLFWRDDLEIDVLHRSYVRRRGHWPRILTHQGPIDDIHSVTLAREKRQDSRGGLLDVWTVGLRFKDASDLLLVAEFLQAEERARDFAGGLASRLQRPFSESPP
jgi:hypothetical protein